MASAKLFSAIVLAAGLSRRFGATNKLTASLSGMPVLARVLDTVCAMGFFDVILVTGAADRAVEEIAASFDCRLVSNPQYEQGMGGSIAAGARSLNGKSGAFIILADMPFVTEEDYREILSSWQLPTDICRPVFDGFPGNPVLFGSAYFEQLAALSGDEGAKEILKQHVKNVRIVHDVSKGVLRDIDTSADLVSASSVNPNPEQA